MIKRNDLVNLVDDIEKKLDRDNFNLENTKNGLKKILSYLESNECLYDSNFYTYGRGDFLKEELERKLKNKEYVDAYFDISDYIKNETFFISRSDIKDDMNPVEIENKNLEYKNSGIICMQEKEILIDMINNYLEI